LARESVVLLLAVTASPNVSNAEPLERDVTTLTSRPICSRADVQEIKLPSA